MYGLLACCAHAALVLLINRRSQQLAELAAVHLL
jgi:hypothetical protein